jgi:hypothetical protein
VRDLRALEVRDQQRKRLVENDGRIPVRDAVAHQLLRASQLRVRLCGEGHA